MARRVPRTKSFSLWPSAAWGMFCQSDSEAPSTQVFVKEDPGCPDAGLDELWYSHRFAVRVIKVIDPGSKLMAHNAPPKIYSRAHKLLLCFE